MVTIRSSTEWAQAPCSPSVSSASRPPRERRSPPPRCPGNQEDDRIIPDEIREGERARSLTSPHPGHAALVPIEDEDALLTAAGRPPSKAGARTGERQLPRSVVPGHLARPEAEIQDLSATPSGQDPEDLADPLRQPRTRPQIGPVTHEDRAKASSSRSEAEERVNLIASP